MYFFSMKFLLAISCLLVFLSCEEVTDNTTGYAPLKRDTNAIPPKELPNPYAATDVSPVDIAYFPPDFPVLKMSEAGTSLPVARVIYSRPHKQGRTIFGNLIKWGEPWRLGANEATELELFRTVTIQGKRVEKGRYILYAVPGEKEWTIILNSNIFSWGLKQDPKKDVQRFKATVAQTPQPIEYFTIVFQKTDGGADLLMSWDNVVARLPFTFQ